MLTIEEKTQAVIDALEDVKGNDITVLNTTKQSQLFDRMIIASGTSNRQTRALADSVIKKMQELGVQVYSSEGEKSGEWVLIDLGEILVHVMQPGVRAYYNLEELWGKHPPRPGK